MLLRRTGADHCESDSAERADVPEAPEKLGEEKPHAVGTGEHQPLVAGDLAEDFVSDLGPRRRHDLDQRQFDHRGAERGEPVAQLGGLFASPGDDDATALQ